MELTLVGNVGILHEFSISKSSFPFLVSSFYLIFSNTLNSFSDIITDFWFYSKNQINPACLDRLEKSFNSGVISWVDIIGDDRHEYDGVNKLQVCSKVKLDEDADEEEKWS